MKRAIEWMTDNHVTANLIMLLLVFGGVVSLVFIKVEIFPDLRLESVSVTMIYPGAAPDEVEESICVKIEEAVSDIQGIEKIVSSASEGRGSVTIELEPGEDVSRRQEEIKAAVDRIVTFPENAEKPVVAQIERISPVINLGIYGDMDEKTLSELTEKMRDELINNYDISSISVTGVRDYEISVEVDEEKLREYNMTFDEISRAIKMGSIDLPGGKIRTDDGDILLRTKQEGKTARDYENIVLRTNEKGHILRIKDVAEVKDGFEESDMLTLFDGNPASQLSIYRTSNQNATKVAKRVYEYLESMEKNLPETVSIVPWRDRSELLRSRIGTMVKNAFLGFVLVLIILSLFLDFRLGMWVASGIIISFTGGFITMKLMGHSINLVSLFSFIVVLGIVVDDAIVVGENIFFYREKGLDRVSASKKGAWKVSTPVIFAVLTTVTAFVPMLYIEGMMRRMSEQLPIIVIPVLLFSLFESLFILPAHLSLVKKGRGALYSGFSRSVVQWVQKQLRRFVEGPFTSFYRLCVNNRYTTMAFALAMLFLTAGIIGGGFLKFTFFPEVESDTMSVFVKMPTDVTVEQTVEVMDKIEEAFEKTKKEISEKSEIPSEKLFRHTNTVIGFQPSKRKGGMGSEASGMANPSKAEMSVELVSSDYRKISTKKIMSLWKEKIGIIPQAQSVEYSSQLMSAGASIGYEISAADFDNAVKAVDIVKEKLGTYDAVYNIVDDFEEGKRELQFSLKPEAATRGITTSAIARQVRKGFFGEETMRIQRGKNEVKVMVRYSPNWRDRLQDIKNMRIRTSEGAAIPFTEVAEISSGRGYSTINRVNRRRVVTVTAEVDETRGNANEINKELFSFIQKDIAPRFEGFTISYTGMQEQQKKSMVSIFAGAAVALFVVYMLLAIPFKSYIQPFVVMSAIPFGFAGAAWAHFILGWSLSMMSIVGVVALSGVVVNDSLVLVDHANYLRREKGQSVFDSFINSAQRRFRPILLTSLTTFFGLLPMIFETNMQARIMIPMAISLGFGVIFATVVTMVFVPSAAMILDDIVKLFFKRGMK